MLLWAILFLIIITISAVLAYKSMKDYQQKPAVRSGEYTLFLIRNSNTLPQILDSLHDAILKSGQMVSLERLFKGKKSALVIFGPKNILKTFADQLNLLELEDYTNVDPNLVTAWEVGTKDLAAFHLGDIRVFEANTPDLLPEEQLWWQLVLNGKEGVLWPNLDKKTGLVDLLSANKSYQLNLQKILTLDPKLKKVALARNQQKIFHTQIRAVLVTYEDSRRQLLTSFLTTLSGGKLVKIPKPYTTRQILKVYGQRSKIPASISSLVLTTDEVLKLVGVQISL